IRREPMKIVFIALASQPGKNVIHTKEKLLLSQVHHERYKIGAPALNLHMVSFGQIVDADVNFRPAGHPAGDFFAEEEIFVAAQYFRRIDRIVVSQCNDGHAQLLAAGIDLVRAIVGLLTKALEQRSVAYSRSYRVDVKVASHAPFLSCGYQQAIKSWRKLHECADGNY